MSCNRVAGIKWHAYWKLFTQGLELSKYPMMDNDCSFNSKARWPKIAICEAEAEYIIIFIFVNSKCGQECDPGDTEMPLASGTAEFIYFINKVRPDTLGFLKVMQ